jgi:hypothetical protein
LTVSLFQTDRCIAVLCPNEVAVYRPVRGKTSVIATEDAAAVFAVRSTAERPAWEGAIEELAAWLVRSASSSMRLHVILSNRFVRFACVPWSEAIASESELQIVAELVMDSCYGDMNGWTVSLDNGGWGKARLACAVENALLARLREAVEVMRMDCQCIEPYFVTCWNRWCGELPVDNALLAVAEPRGPTVVASLRGGMWHSVRATSGEQEAMSLRRLLDKEMLLQGFESMPGRWLHCPSLASDCAEFIGTSIRVLVPQKHASSMSMTMALVGNGE